MSLWPKPNNCHTAMMATCQWKIMTAVLLLMPPHWLHGPGPVAWFVDLLLKAWGATSNYSLSGLRMGSWQDLHDDNKTCMQSSYWELILENGQWLECWITDGLCALPVTGWTGIHGFGYLSPLIWIAPFSAHKLIRQDTAVLHQAIIV